MTGDKWTVDVRGPSECWPWTGTTNRAGYGALWDPAQRRTVLAHRRAWELANGAIPYGAYILHSCDNPPCCNPAHLRPGTAKDNARDVVERGRDAGWLASKNVGQSHGMARLTADDVERIRAMRAAGAVYKDIGAAFGITFQHAQKVCAGKTWVEHGPRSKRARRVAV